MHNILTRKSEEVVQRVFYAQKSKPLDGDFIKLVEDDFNLIGESLDEAQIKSMSKKKFKKLIKMKIKKAAFKHLLSEKDEKSKVKNIKYSKFKEVQILNKARSRNLNVKSNFKTQFDNILEYSVEN